MLQAVHLKLNGLVAAVRGASNRLINVENLTEDEVGVLHRHFARLVELAKADESLTESHSIEDAEQDHAQKRAGRCKGGRGAAYTRPIRRVQRSSPWVSNGRVLRTMDQPNQVFSLPQPQALGNPPAWRTLHSCAMAGGGRAANGSVHRG